MENKKTIIIVASIVLFVGVYFYFKNKKEKEAAAKKLEAELKKAEETKKLLANIKDKFKNLDLKNNLGGSIGIKPGQGLTRAQAMAMAEENKK